jgi:hypothetical protein
MSTERKAKAHAKYHSIVTAVYYARAPDIYMTEKEEV